jgi:hypothetical protein
MEWVLLVEVQPHWRLAETTLRRPELGTLKTSGLSIPCCRASMNTVSKSLEEATTPDLLTATHFPLYFPIFG